MTKSYLLLIVQLLITKSSCFRNDQNGRPKDKQICPDYCHCAPSRKTMNEYISNHVFLYTDVILCLSACSRGSGVRCIVFNRFSSVSYMFVYIQGIVHKCSARALHIMFPPTLSYLLTNCKFRIQCACERQRVFVAVCMPYKMTNVAMRFHAQCSCVSPESFSNNSLIVFSH